MDRRRLLTSLAGAVPHYEMMKWRHIPKFTLRRKP
jgi:hypothetical protein